MVAVQTLMVKDLHSRKSLHVWLFVNRPGKHLSPTHRKQKLTVSTCSNRREFVTIARIHNYYGPSFSAAPNPLYWDV